MNYNPCFLCRLTRCELSSCLKSEKVRQVCATMAASIDTVQTPYRLPSRTRLESQMSHCSNSSYKTSYYTNDSKTVTSIFSDTSSVRSDATRSTLQLPGIERAARLRFEGRKNGTKKRQRIESVSKKRHIAPRDNITTETASILSNRYASAEALRKARQRSPIRINYSQSAKNAGTIKLECGNSSDGGSSMPGWFLGSVAHGDTTSTVNQLWERSAGMGSTTAKDPETLSAYGSARSTPDPDQHRSVSSVAFRPNDPSSSSIRRAAHRQNLKPVQRTLPLETELNKHISFRHNKKGLSQGFTNYVGCSLPGQYRSGGPIGRPKQHHVEVMKGQKARFGGALHEQGTSSQKVQREQENTDQMVCQLKDMLK